MSWVCIHYVLLYGCKQQPNCEHNQRAAAPGNALLRSHLAAQQGYIIVSVL